VDSIIRITAETPRIKIPVLKMESILYARTVPRIKGSIPTVWKEGRERVTQPAIFSTLEICINTLILSGG
jgi:hypothetical protein